MWILHTNSNRARWKTSKVKRREKDAEKLYASTQRKRCCTFVRPPHRSRSRLATLYLHCVLESTSSPCVWSGLAPRRPRALRASRNVLSIVHRCIGIVGTLAAPRKRLSNLRTAALVGYNRNGASRWDGRALNSRSWDSTVGEALREKTQPRLSYFVRVFARTCVCWR